MFDLCTGQQVDCFRAAADTVNGVDFSPCLSLLLTASGHRRYSLLPADGWEDTAAPAADTNGTVPDEVWLQSGDNDSNSAIPIAAKRQETGADSASPCGDECSNDAAGLSLASWRAGGWCNSLRLWRLESQWLAATAAGGEDRQEAAVEGGM